MRPLDTRKLRKAVAFLKLLAHPLRLALLCHIHEAGPISVGELQALEKGRASQSQISQALAHMRRLGLVSAERKGKFVYYALKADITRATLRLLAQHYCASG